MNSENSRTLKPHILTLKLANKLDLRFTLLSLSIYYNWKNIKSSYSNN